MKRFLLAFLVSAFLLGGVAVCQKLVTQAIQVRFVNEVHAHDAGDDAAAAEVPFSVVVTPAFDARTDPFMLRDAAEAEVVRIRITAGERALLEWREDVVRGQVIREDDVMLPPAGTEWFVEATPSPEDARSACALRLQVYRGDVLYADETLWSSGDGHPVAGRISMSLGAELLVLDRGLGAPAGS